ncbi:MAG TPA: nucleotidyltransferase family protein [Gemmatimonadales bacterium]|nr:nucleotidyltransferase family protein [Gemmatimonadales bacterium]
MTAKAVILARGLGTRMRQADPDARLDAVQREAADQGLKAMIPVGRPFLDYVLSGLADAGISSVCLVVAPDPNPIKDYYSGDNAPRWLSLAFAVQAEPLGTADAVLAAEEFAAGESVLVLNADNLYPTSALKLLASLPLRPIAPQAAGLIGFRQSALIAGGNIPAQRIRAFALISIRDDGTLERIIEKPDDQQVKSFGADPLVSMNAWLLPPSIYPACRAITPSPRGELELQDAVRYAMEHLGQQFQVVQSAEPVLDLSNRADIPAVTARLAGVQVRL